MLSKYLDVESKKNFLLGKFWMLLDMPHKKLYGYTKQNCEVYLQQKILGIPVREFLEMKS